MRSVFLTVLLAAMCTRSPSALSATTSAATPAPHPTPERFRADGYAFVYSIAIDQASSVPGGHNQANQSGTGLFNLINVQYGLGSGPLYAAASYEYTPAGFGQPTLSALPQTFIGLSRKQLSAKAGDQFLVSPWANTHDRTLVPPMAFQGVDAVYQQPSWSAEVAQMQRFMSPVAPGFSRTTLLTEDSDSSGFTYARISYRPAERAYALDGYMYGISDLVAIGWLSGTIALSNAGWMPIVAVQGGTERNIGSSYLGKVRSAVFGVALSLRPSRRFSISLASDSIPWRRDTIASSGAVCTSSGAIPTYQLSQASAHPLYFLPQGAAQCAAGGTMTTVYYGGWASPYSDSYAADPLFTTGLVEGMADRRSPGSSERLTVIYRNKTERFGLYTGFSWFQYGNALARQQTQEWDAAATYHVPPAAHISSSKGLVLRVGYTQLRKSNVAYPSGQPFLGGVPLLRFTWLELEKSL